MASIPYLINKFTKGELDPRFIAQADYDGYRKGGRKLRNVIVTPQGGVRKRFGTRYVAQVKDGLTPVTDSSKVRLIKYDRAGSIYDVIIRPDSVSSVSIDIYLNSAPVGNVQANVYLDSQIREIRWVFDVDRIILLHDLVEPQQLWFSGGYSIEPIQFQFFPTFDFTTFDIPTSLPTPNVPYTSNTVTFTPNNVAATTLTASTAVFTSNHVNGLYLGNEGIFRIESVNAAGTVATGYVLNDFANTNAINGTLSSLSERAWNDGAVIGVAPPGLYRGWPSNGTFYQSRLVLGGSPALPALAFASNVKEYFNFDDSDSLDASTWGVESAITGNDQLTDIVSAKSLILLTTKGPSATTVLLDAPTTPTNAFVNVQGSEGSKNINGVFLDNQIFYPDITGNTIWSMAYEIPDTGYNVTNASLLSSHLIRNPVWADLYDPSTVDGRYYLLVNDDGTLAVYHSLEYENITAWTLSNTIGKFVDVSAIDDEAAVLVKRQVVTSAPATAPEAFYKVDDTFTVFRSILNSGGYIFEHGPTNDNPDGDYILIGNQVQFTQLDLQVGNANLVAPTAMYEFLTETGAWEEFTPTANTTNDFTQPGTITWLQSDLDNWKAQTIPGTEKIYGEYPEYYWIRISRTKSNSITVGPIFVASPLINVDNIINLEHIDFEIYMDSQIETITDMTGLVSNLTMFAGQNVFVFNATWPLGTYYVSEGGTIDLGETNASDDITIGIFTPPLVVPMPVANLFQSGINLYDPIHIKQIYVDYYNTQGLQVQGQNIPIEVPGQFMTYGTPNSFTGYYLVPGVTNWDPRAEVTVTQSYPAHFEILAIQYLEEVE